MIFPTPRPSNHMNHFHPHVPMNQMMGYNRSANPNNIQQFIQQLSNPNSSIASFATRGASGLSNTLNNVQQVLKVVQSAAPIVQQYGPVIKNLPTMYRMYKAMKNIDNEDEPSDHEQTNEQLVEESIAPKQNSNTNDNNESTDPKDYHRKSNGQSTPKLFI